MEIVAGLIALIAGLGNGAGYLVDDSARQFLLDQVDQAEVLEVRIQSVPNYRLLNGEIDRILVAGRGLRLQPFPRIAVLELETDPFQLDPDLLQGEGIDLLQPLQAAVRVVVTEADLNQALQSPEILSQFQDLEADLPIGRPDRGPTLIDLRQPQIHFLPDNRIELSAQLVEKPDPAAQESATDSNAESNAESNDPGAPVTSTPEQVTDVTFSAGLVVENGATLRLDEPQFTVGEVPVPREISGAFLGGLNQTFSLSELERQGIILRVLKLQLDEATLELIGFVRVESFGGSTDQAFRDP